MNIVDGDAFLKLAVEIASLSYCMAPFRLSICNCGKDYSLESLCWIATPCCCARRLEAKEQSSEGVQCIFEPQSNPTQPNPCFMQDREERPYLERAHQCSIVVFHPQNFKPHFCQSLQYWYTWKISMLQYLLLLNPPCRFLHTGLCRFRDATILFIKAA